MKIFTLTVWLIVNSTLAYSQGNWTSYKKCRKHPIPVGVKIIYEDQRQNLWVYGYGPGLYLFDGAKWTQFTWRNGLKNSIITTIKEDSDGIIWIGTPKGLSRYKEGRMEMVPTKLKGGFPKGYISCIYEDSKKNLWFGTGLVDQGATAKYPYSTGKLIRYDGNDCTNFSKFSGSMFNDHPVGAIIEDKDNNLWISSGWIKKGDYTGYNPVFAGELSILKENKWDYLINKIPYEDKWIIDRIYKDASGNLWFSARSDKNAGCVIKYDGNNLEFLTKANGFLNYIKHFYQDSKGIVWFGGYRGLVIMENGEARYARNDSNRVLSMNVNVIKEDSRGNIWVGTTNGVYVFTDKKKVKHLEPQNGLAGKSNIVKNIVEDFEGKIWVFTQNKFITKSTYFVSRINSKTWDLEEFPLNKIHADLSLLGIYEDSSNNLWFFTRREILKYSQ